MALRIGADVGGTFTDIIVIDDRGGMWTHKVPSSQPDFELAVIAGIRRLIESVPEIADTPVTDVVHGTTVATNAVLERRGAKSALVTTKGFRDVFEIRRLRVPELFNLFFEKPTTLVPRHLRFELSERVSATGEVLAPLEESEMAELVTKLTAGYHFGLAEMITQATSVVTLIADIPSVILRMDGHLLRTRLLNHADICYRLMQTMSRAIFGLTQELERASFENVHTRLARLLLRKRPSGAGLPIAPVTQSKVSHQELAVQIGASRETVSRALADFKRKGIIETSYRNITVRNRDGLMEYIGEYDQW